MAEARAGAVTDVKAIHGLEQQLIHALIDCLSLGPAEVETPTARRHRGIVAQYEDLPPAGTLTPIAQICAALDVTERTLRDCCKQHLGMGPGRYSLFQRIQHVHRQLLNAQPRISSVSAVATRHQFRDLGRFAGNYRAIYGELPSATLRRGPRLGVTELRLRRTRVKVL